MSTFVLVHGAWHGGWCWRKLSPLLRASGHEAYAPTLAGMGERSHTLSREITLNTHIRDVVNLLEFEDLNDTILVGHSYGGMIIAGVAELVPHRVLHLVYLDAITPGDDGSFGIEPSYVAEFRRRAIEKGNGWLVNVPTDWGTFGVTEESNVKWLKERLTPQPLATLEQKGRFENPAALALPKTFIWCSGSDASEKRNIREDWPSLPLTFPSNWGFYEMQTGHDAMLTAPGELERILTEVAKNAQGVRPG